VKSPAAWLRRLAEETYTPPFAQQLPSNAAHYAATASRRAILWRRLRRWLWLAVNGQTGLERTRIVPADRRILWIHAGMPQIGDSLMDLACRDLLKDREVDLLIDAHLVPLYAHDDVFRHVGSDAAEAARRDYELVIVLGLSAQNLRAKLRHFRKLPWVSLHRYYTSTEFHRTLFAYYRLDQLLGGKADETAVPKQLRPHMIPGAAAVAAVAALGLPARFMVVVVGGVSVSRTYTRWGAVVAAIRARGVAEPIVLLGAANGRGARDEIVAAASNAPLIDAVDRHSLPEVYEIVRRSSLVVCTDGGLLHIANAAEVPTISLFNERIDPSFRLTPANRSIALYIATKVSDIAPDAVADAVLDAWRKPPEAVSVRRL
jgi:heptosyltransferase-2